MLAFNTSIIEIIKQRRSCRTCQKKPIAAELVSRLAAFVASLKTGPLATPLRFELAVAEGQDLQALQGLGTYGFIKDPAGFIIGAVGAGERNLEDFGFGMEAIILYATSLGLGSCWLGGSFAKSRFAARIRATSEEIVPAVASIGYPAEEKGLRLLMRTQIKADVRKPWQALFFQGSIGNPLSEESAGVYAVPLAMLRLAPSASNGQPWRIVQDGSRYHFCLQRRPSSKPKQRSFLSFTIADLPRVDMGIAMCHFQLTAEELGVPGRWQTQDPAILQLHDLAEYVVTWIAG